MNLNLTKALSLLFVIGLSSTQIVFSQNVKKTISVDTGKNLIKLNLPSLAMKTLNVQYERAIFGKRVLV